jgi:membrane protease YdiL (CAAX protease family)
VSRTRELPVNLVFLVPFLFLYELALLATQSPVENAAGAWVRAGARSLGRGGLMLLVLLVCLLVLVLLVGHLRDAMRTRGVYGGMILEGLFFGAVLGSAASVLAATLPLDRLVDLPMPRQQGSPPAPPGMLDLRHSLQAMGLAIGAGIFEELIFRGLLLGGVFMALRHLVGADRITSGVIAVLISAYLFSDYHHWGVSGEIYDPAVFSFRFHAGVMLGAIFLLRGLGIAAFAHGFYDVLVMVM